MKLRSLRTMCVSTGAAFVAAATLAAQAPAPKSSPTAAKPASAASATATAPADYVIGPDDVLAIVFWQDKDFTSDVTVRPDGKITLPLINDIQAAGLTTDQLRDAVLKAAVAYIKDPTVTIEVKAINSRKVYIVGAVLRPGPFTLTDHMTVLNLITMAGGLQEFAEKDDIGVLRTVNGKPQRIRVNYEDIAKGKNLSQNIELKAGDQVVVR